MIQLAVIGNPIAQSRSPVLHQLFAQQVQQEIRYEKFEAPVDGFTDLIRDLQQQGYRGCNVTMPFKEQAFALADTHSERARLAEAVNTLWFRDDKTIYGDNTDGVGLVRDLTVTLRQDLSGQRILMLGAGGAVQGILGTLLAKKPAELIIANRTVAKARQLVDKFSPLFPATQLSACSLDNLPEEPCTLVINATAIGVKGEPFALNTRVLDKCTFAYDLVYRSEPTPFMQWAAPHVAGVSDGLGMLVEQGAESFSLWCGTRPDTAPVLNTMRDQLCSK